MASRAANTKTPNRLPIFDGHAVETQRLKQTGSVDKDQWIAEPHPGDAVVFTITRSIVSDVGHKFTADGVIRIENLHVMDVIVDATEKGPIATLYRELFTEEQKQHRERSGKANLDDAVDEAAAAAAAAAAADQVAAARAKKSTKAAKKTK